MKLIVEHNDLRWTHHQISKTKDRHPPHESRIETILAQECQESSWIKSRFALLSPILFRALQSSLSSKSYFSIDRISCKPRQRKHGIEISKTCGRNIHRLANDESRQRKNNGLDHRHFACNKRAICTRVVVAPDGGSDGDDSGPRCA